MNSEKHRFLKEYMLYGVGIVASRFVDFLLVPLFASFLGPSTFGMLDVLLSTSLILFIFSEMQVLSGVSRGYFEAQKRKDSNCLFGTALILYASSTGFWVVSSWAFFTWNAKLFEDVSTSAIVAILISLFPRQLFNLFQLKFRFDHRPLEFLSITLGEFITSVVFTLTAVTLFDASIEGVLWGLCLSKLLWSTVLLYFYRRWFDVKWDRGIVREILMYSIPLLPAVLAAWGQNHLNRFVLASSLTLQDVGVYGLAMRIAAAVLLLATAFKQTWEPMATKWYGEAGSEPRFSQSLNRYAIIGCAVCTLLALFGPSIAAFVGGPGFNGAGDLVAYLAFGFMWSGAITILAAGNAWARKTYWNTVGIAFGAMTNMVLLIVLVDTLGVSAAGIGFLVGTIVSSAIVYATAQLNHYIPYRRMVLIGSIVYTTVIVVLVSGINLSQTKLAATLNTN